MLNQFLVQKIAELEQATGADDAVGGHALVGLWFDHALDDLDRAEDVLRQRDPAVGGRVAEVGDVGPPRRKKRFRECVLSWARLFRLGEKDPRSKKRRTTEGGLTLRAAAGGRSRPWGRQRDVS